MGPQKRRTTLPHLDAQGAARMVDVGAKPATHRVAIAEAFVRMRPSTIDALLSSDLPKGDALAVARIAGISAAKKTADLIPLAHPIPITHASIEVSPDRRAGGVHIEARIETIGGTGVEMEALVAVMTAALALYDMAKSIDRGMCIERVELVMKSGGRSGTYLRGSADDPLPRRRAKKRKRS